MYESVYNNENTSRISIAMESYSPENFKKISNDFKKAKEKYLREQRDKNVNSSKQKENAKY